MKITAVRVLRLSSTMRTEGPFWEARLVRPIDICPETRAYRACERAAEYKALGYLAQKWFFRHGPMSGHDGMRKNVELVRTLRETLGDDYDIMLDCWQSFDPIYAVELAAYASVHDLMVIPHGHSTSAGLHFSRAQPPLLTPIQEYLVKWSAINQHFLANPVTPLGGEFALPTLPGLGMDLDPAKIEAQAEVYSGGP
jgi:L-alanine-DL-glutamate epimerase-like enolase superfamily enzyme